MCACLHCMYACMYIHACMLKCKKQKGIVALAEGGPEDRGPSALLPQYKSRGNVELSSSLAQHFPTFRIGCKWLQLVVDKCHGKANTNSPSSAEVQPNILWREKPAKCCTRCKRKNLCTKCGLGYHWFSNPRTEVPTVPWNAKPPQQVPKRGHWKRNRRRIETSPKVALEC